jgi:hypothetical protein
MRRSQHVRRTVEYVTAHTIQNQRMERLQDSIDSVNNALTGHIANLSLARWANELAPHQDFTSAHDRGPNVPRCKWIERTTAYTSLVRLQRWLHVRFWEIEVLSSSAKSWTMRLYNINIRPAHSCVFDVVRSGNLKVVRELLASGTLSLRDRAHMWNGSTKVFLRQVFGCSARIYLWAYTV